MSKTSRVVGKFEATDLVSETPETGSSGNALSVKVQVPHMSPPSEVTDNSNGIATQELPEIDSLLFDGKEGEMEDIFLEDILSGEVICFDDIPEISGDPFSDHLTNDSQCELMNINVPNSLSIDTPCFPPDCTSSSINVPANGFVQPQPVGREQTMCTTALDKQMISTDWNEFNPIQLFSNNLMEWVMQLPNPHCQSCQLMRRVVHSNGVQDTKLEIHCLEGQSYHAVLQTRICIEKGYNQSNLTHQMIQFPYGNAEYMKHFLMQYSLLRANEGFVLRHDCVMVNTDIGTGMSIISDQSFPGPLANLPIQTDISSSPLYRRKPALNQWQVHQNNFSTAPQPPKIHKSSVAAQRERTGKLQLSDVAEYFHLPITEAAKQLALCPTVLKKICRRNGLRRWPHRKIKSIERMIATLEQSIAEGNGQGAESITREIENLKNERAKYCGGYLPQPT